MIEAAVLALRQSVSPPFRAVLLKSVGLAILLLLVIGGVLQKVVVHYAQFGDSTLNWIATAIAAAGIIVGGIFLLPAVTSMMAGIFLDEIAAEVERRYYPGDPPGRPIAFGEGLMLALRFTALVILVNLVVLILLLVPGVNVALYLVANGYLLGREYFELAALRFRPLPEVRALRRQNGLTVFAGGMLIAGFLAIPIVNLATPLVATAFMVHLHKLIERRSGLAVTSRVV
jgi:CysZ protein